MKPFLTIMIFVSTLSLYAAPVAHVKTIRGEVTFNGKPISKGDVLKDQGEFSVADKSYIRMHLEDAGHVIVIGANSKASIDFNQPKEDQQLILLSGISRWVSGRVKNSSKAGIKTANASMGIRGTDFLVTYLPLLGESEIICFGGEVEFANVKNRVDSRIIGKNQWGGLGGRFGDNIGRILDLPPNVINHFQNAIPLD